MRVSLFILLFLCSVFFVDAQKKNQETYFYTQASKKYFTDGEMDSLYRTVIEGIFKENAVPETLLDKHYVTVKSILAGTVRNNLVASFKEIEGKAKKTINAANGSQQFADNKKLYTDAFVKHRLPLIWAYLSTFYASHSVPQPMGALKRYAASV